MAVSAGPGGLGKPGDLITVRHDALSKLVSCPSPKEASLLVLNDRSLPFFTTLAFRFPINQHPAIKISEAADMCIL